MHLNIILLNVDMLQLLVRLFDINAPKILTEIAFTRIQQIVSWAVILAAKFSTSLNVVISNQMYKQKMSATQVKKKHNKQTSKITIFYKKKKIKNVTPFASFQVLPFSDKPEQPPCQMHFHKNFLSCKSDKNFLSSAEKRTKIELLETSDMPATRAKDESCKRMVLSCEPDTILLPSGEN
ncbi:hypothetical protein RFI_00344 [Reticulomyxa filosa]|uniref:Uncharacterized protein n=1 Tax=Reticulomyxa filosa TaxID=46433 RepID=X6PG99_RETFI|nr:hypothetical protein RFI_00344 [Reticulomyxa filosa]|eukprot:ETO36717.1 hypothetical protein RFI_00344 [Reticulomyxa filosa]